MEIFENEIKIRYLSTNTNKTLDELTITKDQKYFSFINRNELNRRLNGEVSQSISTPPEEMIVGEINKLEHESLQNIKK